MVHGSHCRSDHGSDHGLDHGSDHGSYHGLDHKKEKNHKKMKSFIRYMLNENKKCSVIS